MLSKRKSILVLSILLFVFCEHSTIARMEQKPAINYGLAIINSCKHLHLTLSSHEEYGVNANDSNFKQVIDWFYDNIYKRVGTFPKNVTGEYASLYILSEPLPLKQPEDFPAALLLYVHLNADTLGPNFKEKVAELKTLLKNKKPDKK